MGVVEYCETRHTGLQPAAPQLHENAAGCARLRLTAASGTTRLADLFHAQPLRVLFPLREPGDIFQAAITCVAGGLVAGDRHDIRIALERDAQAMVMGQAAEKIYRSNGPDCHIDVDLAVGAGAWLEWLPQETILFDRARLRRRNHARVAAGARLLAGDILVFGRRAHAETLRHGLVHDAWEIHGGDGRLAWKDVLHMEGDLGATIAHPACFDGAEASASLIFAAPDAGAHLEAARAIAAARESAALRIGVTSFNNLLLARFIGRNALELREAFAKLWCGLRQGAAKLPPVMPRLWSV
jgi:urease accessory protein